MLPVRVTAVLVSAVVLISGSSMGISTIRGQSPPTEVVIWSTGVIGLLMGVTRRNGRNGGDQ